MKKTILVCGLLGVASSLSACATVQPWERDVTARESMQLNKNPNMTAANEHIYFSKEASAGGRSYDGGGCGCN
ncbi:DUF4266 domain-containing protein [Kordiimonas marina]|uniref:DUF4266 domain-containing protein n=1 Tax=Kordiimonas marina TaxID=2872312 RepID=UPI001FF67AE1|nr:DUF4266 domain-containing protein [Kordiimonas marina]MCJ9430090.1 DUF4266 domain-containing protein [Kordiimonas marina]